MGFHSKKALSRNPSVKAKMRKVRKNQREKAVADVCSSALGQPHLPNEDSFKQQQGHEEVFGNDSKPEPIAIFGDHPEVPAPFTSVHGIQQPGCSSYFNNKDSTEGVPIAATDDDLMELYIEPENSSRKQTRFEAEGLRVIDPTFYWDQILRAEDHNPAFGCSLRNLILKSETRAGLISTFHYQCNMCNVLIKIQTSANQDYDINTAAVAGIMNIGAGFTQMNTFFSSLNIPPMSTPRYLKTQDKVSDAWEATALEEMEQAAKEEKKLALEDGTVGVDENGIPIIRVVCDGSWAKRSYRGNYSSLSGVAAIVGYKTKRVLYMAVKNKYCYFCKISENKGVNPKTHTCYKNWTGSSTSMEAAILSEGFCSSLNTYGLIYGEMIADGDSSTFKKIKESNPYPTVTVEKIECTNHLLRNYTNKLRDLCKDSTVAVPIVRKLVQKNILKLRCAVSKAVGFRKGQNNSTTENVDNLKKDILNSPSHIFGEHEHCKAIGYFCAKDSPDEDNFVPDLRRCGMYEKLMRHVKNIAIHSKSLLQNVHSNTVEQLYSGLAKYTGGKRINYCGKRSYQTRCALAVVARNTKYAPITSIHKKLTGRKPGKHVRRLERSQFQRIMSEKRRTRKRRTKCIIGNRQDADYGTFSEKPDITSDEMTLAKEEFLKTLKKSPEDRIQLEKDTIDNYVLWKEERRKLITASNFSKICNMRPYTSCKKTVNSLIYGEDIFAKPLLYGRKNEINGLQAVEEKFGIKIRKCGLFTTHKVPYLGATPDGIAEGNEWIVEVKCPYSARADTPEDAINKKCITFWKTINNSMVINEKHSWYYQIQGQMYITDILKLWSGGLDLQGPLFLNEPQHRVEFSNSSGGRVDCTAHGSPAPEVEWISADGTAVRQIPDLRLLFPNGSLVFPPFLSERYRHDVHTALYRCRLRSSLGSVLSRDVHVKAVVKQKYDIQVHDEYVIAGNTAVLKCKIPSYVADYVMVTSWVQDTTNNIYPLTDIGGKYVVLANGDLYISNAGPGDGYKNYACRTVHRLTGEVQISTYPGRVIVTEPKDTVQPRITVEKYNARRVGLGDDVTLPCVAQGYPIPSYYWKRELQGQSVPVALGERLTMLTAGLLKISKVRLEDRGVYICFANNSAGEESVRVTLEITAPLSAHVQPQVQVVDVGKEASFQCIVGGYPISQISWLHNGKPVAPDNRMEVMVEPPRLTIRQLSKDDRGMYQCIVSNNWDQAQATAELDMGDAGPELVYWFSEQTLQPGPTVSLKCVASGNPPPQFTWTLDGFPIPDHPRFLVGQYVTIQDDVISHVNVTNIKAEDGGEYTCTAHNSVGKISHSARVNVFGLPFVREMPKITGVAGTSLIIKCPVAGYPIETITWEREGQTLPVNRRQRVYANGTLVVEQTQRKEDAGTYTCQAQNRQRNSSRRDVEVQVIVPPKILPINPMTDLLREGMRAAITCQIMEGDLPITFSWERDGKPVSNNVILGTVVRRIDEFSSSLIIDQVSSAHSGNYTCRASNVAGAERYIVPLTVNVPPRWTVEPTDSNVAAGQEATLNCQADGYPTPVVTWRRAVGSQPGEYKEFLYEPNVHQYQNGSINFIHIAKDNEGQYLCEAKNNIGTGVSKVIFLKVNAPAHFPQKTKQIQVVKGEQAHLQCTAMGDIPMEIMWKMGGQQIVSDVDQRYSIREQALAEGMVSELGIERTIRQDTGVFTCSASNSYGQDEMSIQLIVQEIPECPKNVRVTEQLSRSIGISWTQPHAGNSPINNYIIQYKQGSEPWPAQPLKVTVPGSQTSTTVDNLKPSQLYYLRILAENRLGMSEPSQVVQVSTLEEVPSGTPLDVRAEAKSSTDLVVTWEPPSRDTWNGNLLGYHVGFQLVTKDTSHSAQSFNFKSVEVRPHYGGEAVLQGMMKFATYNIIVQAYNSRGSGPASEPVTARTLEDSPSVPPENVQCSVLSAQSLHISWEPPLPEGRNGIIQGYKVTYHSIGEWFDNDDQETKMINQLLRTTISGLRKYTNYSMTVLAYTASGEGVRSDPVYCHTEEDVPSAPADIKAVLSATNKILVSWLPPKYSNGLLVGYTFYMSTLVDGKEEGTNKRVLSPTTEMHETSRQQDTATCQFWVTASTRVGEGESTRVITVSLSKTVPAKIASFGREVISAWKQDITLPCKRVGIPLPNAIWRLNGQPLEMGGRRAITSNATLTVKDVQSVDQANYSCSVENQYGRDDVLYVLKVLVPPEPPALNVVDAFTDSLHLRWSDQKNGGSPILGYVINYKRDHGDWEELQISARTDEYMLRNLWCGTRYSLYITAYNRIGTGLPCDIVSAHTKGTVPVKPKQSQMLTMNATVVTVWLDSWGDGGCGILYFVIEYRIGRRSSWVMASGHVKPTERIYSITELNPATEYQLKVTAHNNAGDSPAIYNFTTLTLMGVAPELSPPVSHSGEHPFANARVLVPIILSILILIALVVALFWRRKMTRERDRSSHTIGESPSMAQIQNKQNRDQQYLAVRVARGPQPIGVEDTYKAESADYIEDICPYATFQLSKPTYSESSYSGNVYSGPYHSVRGSFVYHDVKPPPIDKFKLGHNKEPEYTKVRRKGGRLRDPHSESQESDNLGSTDSEVKKILTLHLPISEYDTLGSDSEGDGRATSQELMSFTHRMRGGAEGSSSSSETSPPSGSINRKQYPTRKPKSKAVPLTKRHVRSSSGYSSHNDETTFSISHSFNDRIHPPTRFSDMSDPECEKVLKHRGMSRLTREAFQINV